MLISNHYNNQIYKPIATPNFQNRTKLGKCVDEFVKQPRTEEKAKTLTENIKSFLDHPKKHLGEGFRGTVYKIDDKYVLKYPKHIRSELQEIKHENLPDLNCLRTYYGSPIVVFDNGAKILRNVSSNGKQTCAGIPQDISNLMLYHEKQQYWSEKYLPIFAELPQKSFDAIAKDFSALNKIGGLGYNYAFDTKNPNNIILVGKNTLRIVDDLDYTYSLNENTTGGLLRLFLEKMDLDYLAPKDLANQANRKALMKKIILAGEKYELPLFKQELDIRTWRNVTEEFCEYRELTDGLKRLRKENPDIKTRLEKVDEFLDDIFNQSTNYYDGLWTIL